MGGVIAINELIRSDNTPNFVSSKPVSITMHSNKNKTYSPHYVGTAWGSDRHWDVQ